MKKIEPFVNIESAALTLDNGGRFFNIMSKADDGIISKSELAKVAGVYTDKQKMILFFDLAVSKLRREEKELLINSLNENLRENYELHQTDVISPVEVKNSGELAKNTIVSGFAKFVENKSEFVGFIMIPIVTGNVTTFTMVPLTDVYDIYEIADEQSSDVFILAHAKGKTKLPTHKIIVGGILKELKASKNKKSEPKKYLESYYYMDSQ